MGKRQMAQLQPFEFVITLLIADLAASPMGDMGASLLGGVVPILALLALHSAIALASMRSQKFRGWICGKPSVLIRDGKIQAAELERLCYDLNDLMEAVRNQGVMNPADVSAAILETNGGLSVFPTAAQRPVCPADLQLQTKYEGIPLTLILDGRTQHKNLLTGGLSDAWLMKQLAPLGYTDTSEVFLCSLDTQGRLFVQGAGRRGKLHVAPALKPEQVRW
jgi:uncharacterized membrane protein YcaP (DUF421 family)